MQGHQLFMLNLSFRMVVSGHPSYFHRCPVLHIAHPVPYVSRTATLPPQALLLGSNSGLLDGVSLVGRTSHTDQPSTLATSEIP